MSEQITREDLQYYVDWTSLKYYDDRIKSYIQQQGSITVGGHKHSCWLDEPPVQDNLNKLFCITDSFVTGSTFVDSGVSCGAGSIVYLDTVKEGFKYRVLVNIPDSAKITPDDWNNLLQQVENMTHLISTYTKSVDRIEKDTEDLEDRLKAIVVQMQSVEHSIHDLLHAHEERFATKDELRDALDNLDVTPGTGSTQNFATKSFVLDEIAKLPINSLQLTLNQVQLQQQETNQTINSLTQDITEVETQVSDLETDLRNNYITVENGVTLDQVETQVRTVVQTEVETMVDEKIADALANGVPAPSIGYGEF